MLSQYLDRECPRSACQCQHQCSTHVSSVAQETATIIKYNRLDRNRESVTPADSTTEFVRPGNNLYQIASKSTKRFLFSWIVKLKDNGELFVEGTMESRKRMHTKSIDIRLCEREIICKYGYIYQLIGHLKDEMNELPDYVNWKFRNGFPEDWQNVVTTWKMLVIQTQQRPLIWPTLCTSNANGIMRTVESNCSCMTDNCLKDSKKTVVKNCVWKLVEWTPVMAACGDIEYCLVFRGLLLDTRDRITNEEHVTDIICRRHSATMIETVNGEFYELIGVMDNTKARVPKELVPWCSNGCPKDFNLFCEKWKRLRPYEDMYVQTRPATLGWKNTSLLSSSYSKLTNTPFAGHNTKNICIQESSTPLPNGQPHCQYHDAHDSKLFNTGRPKNHVLNRIQTVLQDSKPSVDGANQVSNVTPVKQCKRKIVSSRSDDSDSENDRNRRSETNHVAQHGTNERYKKYKNKENNAATSGIQHGRVTKKQQAKLSQNQNFDKSPKDILSRVDVNSSAQSTLEKTTPTITWKYGKRNNVADIDYSDFASNV